MVDTVVHLAVPGGDDFYFTSFEVPQRIPFGGRQRLAVHHLVGGRRVVDAMGRDDKPLAWSGFLLGKSALPRARYLDWLRTSGTQCVLSWSELKYTVAVESFDPDWERFYKIPYSISLLVVQDLSQPVNAATSPSLDDVVRDDITKALAAANQVNNGTLTAMVATLNAAVQSVANFSNATQAQIASVTGPLQQAQSQVSTLISISGQTVAGMATLGGVVPGSSVTQQAVKLTSGVAAAAQASPLLALQSVLGRMGRNLGLKK